MTADDALSDDAKKIARLERRVARERTARVAAEQIADDRMRELWLTNRELDKRVEERTGELEDALARLEHASTAVAGFLSNISHEMFTPLNGIVGMLELLRNHVSNDQATSYVDAALTSSERLDRLLQRILDLTEVRAGRIVAAAEATTLGALADELESAWRMPALAGRHLLTVAVDSEPDEPINVDVDRLLQIAGEFIQNAIQHGEPGVITVELDCHEPTDLDPSLLSVKITDGGPGFDITTAPRFTDAFARIDTSAGRATEGAGIGISLARAIAEALGGRIELSSSREIGTTACAWLPVG